MEFNVGVIAAGCDSGEVGKLAKIGTGPGILSEPIPVERRFVIELFNINVEKYLTFLK